MKRLNQECRYLAPLFWKKNPGIVVMVFLSGTVMGILPPISVWINTRVFDGGLSVAAGEMTFIRYLPYLVGFVAAALLPAAAGNLLMQRYVVPRCRLILRMEYKGRMLQKLKRIRYEHLERADSREVMEKAYDRVEEAGLFLFPFAGWQILSAGISSVGTLFIIGSVRWWILPVLLVPFLLETVLASGADAEVYNERERYWKKERFGSILGDMLRTREHIWENYLMEASDHLIHIYEERLRGRNQEYERFYLKHLFKNFRKLNLTKLGQFAGAVLLLFCYWKGAVTIGELVSLTLAVFSGLFAENSLGGLARVVRGAGRYKNAYDFYDRYLELSEETYGKEDNIPKDCTIEFRDVWFTYPGEEFPVLRGLSFQIEMGEKVSLIGKNGAGKSTIVKLLLGLFRPDRGCILAGGKPLEEYSLETRKRLFGAVFQDFGRYAISFGENIGIGDVEQMEDQAAIWQAVRNVGLEEKVFGLPEGIDTLLGREFEDGMELSGGQWQRIALARAFLGDRPILILDEPTSQLDPMSESRLYSEFAELATGKTALFISHRLGSTKITDRILVLSEGRVVQNGTHEELVEQEGVYREMFEAQKQWYVVST